MKPRENQPRQEATGERAPQENSLPLVIVTQG